ncbi:unnamed protein product, partial [Prorocentrum cordatum]
MSWRNRAPWRGGRRRQPGAQSGTWAWQPDDEGPPSKKKRGGKKGAEYAVCSVCQHWEYVHYGNESCGKCGGAYLGGDDADNEGAEQRESAQGAGAAPMPPHLLREMEMWSVHYPALASVAKDAAAPPPPRVPEYTDGDLDRLAALEQTALAKEVEQATKQQRLAAQEAERNLEMARQAVREMDAKKNRFNIGQFKVDKRAEAQAAARAWTAEETVLMRVVGPLRARVQRLLLVGPLYEHWEAVKQMEQSIAAPMDDASEVGESEFGDQHRDKLDQLRKWSLDQALTEPERNRVETILIKQAAQKATKRLKTARGEGAASFGEYLNRCTNEAPWHEQQDLLLVEVQ